MCGFFINKMDNASAMDVEMLTKKEPAIHKMVDYYCCCSC
jgi:hypothetical protein